MRKTNLRVLILLASMLLAGVTADGQGTAFTYQGKLSDNGNPANGQYDFQFKLFDTQTVGTGIQQGAIVPASNVAVTAGIFTVQLDFGACATCFNGSARFLEIAVKPTSGSTFTTLAPRQPITSTPYGIKTQNLTVNGPYDNGTGTSFPASNTFTGEGAGLNTTPDPVLYGYSGKFNSFYGAGAGQANTSGLENAFFGSKAGKANTTGYRNAFFGDGAGQVNTTGEFNAFFGSAAGGSNTTGGGNAFFGRATGFRNTIGSFNTFIGGAATFDVFNPTGDNNTLLGYATQVNSGVSNGTAIGAYASVTQSNSLILGSINGVNGCAGVNNCASVNVGIGTTVPDALLDVERDGATFPETARFTTYGTDNKILGRATGGSRSTPVATPTGRDLLLLGGTGYDGDSFVSNPKASIVLEAAEGWTSTANGTRIRFHTTTNGTTAISSSTPRMTIEDDGSVGIGTASPADLLHVNGIIRVATLGAGNTTNNLCRNSSNQIATCNSSSLRYKTDIAPFTSGGAVVKRLRPITFTWKQGGARDIGFGAEDVAAVEPLFAFTNDKGEIEGVKYDRLSVALVNAIKDQQSQIEQQQTQIKAQEAAIQQQQEQIMRQQLVISSLKMLVCADHPQADICR